MTYRNLINAMIAYEMDAKNPPDGRRVIRDARQELMATQQTDGDLPAAIKQARGILESWAA